MTMLSTTKKEDFMKRILCICIVIALVVFSACQTEHSGKNEMAAKDGVFIHISHGTDDTHRVLMGLKSI
jgi:hypothetical protein